MCRGRQAGSAKVANMVLLGALLEKVGFLVPAKALAIIQTKTGKAALLEANRKEEGRKFIEAISASTVLQGAQREAAGLTLH